MKYTERFFKFPIKVYDELSLVKANIEDEERQKQGAPPERIHVDSAIALKVLDHKEITSWTETFTNDEDIDYVAEHGFPCTAINTKDGKEFQCMWSLDEFESKLNEHVTKLEKEKLI